jgi:hypothetical protein
MHQLAALLPYGAAARSEITLATSGSSVARWTADGDLIHLHPGVVILPTHLTDAATRARAAALWAVTPLPWSLADAWVWSHRSRRREPNGARVAIELDGAGFHGSHAARERDLRRDTALAALGGVVLRFSYARLMADPLGRRREIEAVVRRRLAWG